MAGGVQFKSRVLLAPVDAVFDAPCREIYRSIGGGGSFGEICEVHLVLRNFERAKEKLIPFAGEEPYFVQLAGHEPELLAEAARKVYENIQGVHGIDFNLGCPSKLVVKSGNGVALMKNPELAARCVEAMANATPLPVSVKMRAGFDPHHKNAPEVAAACVDAGACMVTVHGRVRNQFYSGEVDFDIIAQTVDAVEVPVIGNGGIKSVEDAQHMIEKTGCSGVMVATGAFGNPWLLKEIESGRKVEPSIHEKFATVFTHIRRNVEFYGERRGVVLMRKHLGWYIRSAPYAAQLRKRIMTMESYDELISVLGKYLSGL